MFVATDDLRYRTSLFNSVVAPRPIGWVSTLGPDGIANLAPFSYFNGVSATPPMVMFANNAPEDRAEKDTLANVRLSGEFCVNLATYDLREAMNATSAAVPRSVDEFRLAGLTPAPCELVRCARVAESPVSLECRLMRIVDFPPLRPQDRASAAVFGQVIAVHVADDYLDAAGHFDVLKAQPIARLGGFQYLRVTELFELRRPAKPTRGAGAS
ncbi:flavin reductase family protein [Variovorax defluvii]|uniref:Flavin reductase family protein n=1 Tax=Variovorax defluvii TaxID=913761 RepID=A0ABP8ICU2_9BURK